MRTRMSKPMIALVLMLSGAFLTAGPGTGCLSLGAESLLAEANFCFIINCQNGIFGGTIEPCPPIQFAMDNVGDGKNLVEAFENSDYIREFREAAKASTHGCFILEEPEKLKAFVDKLGAKDVSGRGTAYEELSVMRGKPGQESLDTQIREKHWFYRFAKKNYFFGFGAAG